MGGNYSKDAFSSSEVLFSILSLIKFPLIWFLLLLLVYFILIKLFPNKVIAIVRLPSYFWVVLECLLLGSSLALFIYLSSSWLQRIPHVPDEIAYLFQAKVFSMGKLYLDTPKYLEYFPTGFVDYKGRWFSQYPFGHPLILSIGFLVKAPWLVPPVVGTLTLLFIYLIGAELYSKRVGFIASLLVFATPFFQMHAINFMSHNTACLFFVLFIYLFIKLVRYRNSLVAILAGLALGYLLNVRPYTCVFLAIPFIIYLISEFLTSKYKLRWMTLIVFFGCGLLIMVVLHFAYNFILTGNYFKSTYHLGYLSSFGFTPERPLSFAIMDTYVSLSIFKKIYLAWPEGLSFFLFWLYVVSVFHSRKRIELTFLGAIFSLLIGYLFYKGPWMMYGPRFWFEGLPILAIITVVGLEKLSMSLDAILAISKTDETLGRILFRSYITITFIFLILLNLGHWLDTKPNEGWLPEFTPHTVGELKGFNFADTTFIVKANTIVSKPALVFLEYDYNWWSYIIPVYSSGISFDGDLVYAVDLGDLKNKQLMKAYSNYHYYRAVYSKNIIVEY